MAEEPEHKMLFDLKGRRKRVVQVIYVLLAVLMAGSLLVIGLPGGISPFGGGTTINQDAAEANIERAEELQQRLSGQPNNENLAQEVVRARFSAGQSLYSVDEETGQTQITEEATDQFELAAQAWDRYLKATKNQPNPEIAQLVANMLFTLSQGSTVAQFESNIADAAAAQKFVVQDALKQQQSGGAGATNQLATLAMYQLYGQDFEAAEKTRERALASTPDDQERQAINQTLNATEKDARRIGKVIARAKKQARQSGGESLQNPLGSLGTDSSTGGTTSP